MDQYPSMRPYMVRAVYSWCIDSGFTPYITVSCSPMCVVPAEHVKGGMITLNISPLAANQCDLGLSFVTFQARFNGVIKDISVPVGRIVAIFAKENGQGMHFSPEDDPDLPSKTEEKKIQSEPSQSAGTKKSWLRVVK